MSNKHDHVVTFTDGTTTTVTAKDHSLYNDLKEWYEDHKDEIGLARKAFHLISKVRKISKLSKPNN